MLPVSAYASQLPAPTRPLASPRALEDLRRGLCASHDPQAIRVLVCCGTGCKAVGSEKVLQALRAEVAQAGLAAQVQPEVKQTGCHGFCSRGPLLTIMPQGIFYQRVRPEDAADIVGETLKQGRLVQRLLYQPPQSKEHQPRLADIAFFNRQTKVVLQRVGQIDPLAISDALREGAYAGLTKCLTEMSPEQVIAEVRASRLRGRGGAGFATGVKWQSCRDAPGARRYVICNGDEGDPGAFMDASLMEGDPHALLEGMAIAAYAVGSDRGFIYVRLEYPLAVRTLQHAIGQAEALSLLGQNIMGTGFNFRVTLATGAGAYVCGESSALMASLEGLVGRPRAKYIRSVEKGFRDSPTSLNNVETFCNIPQIILRGGLWYRNMGTERSAGTKVFSLTGNVHNVGLVEVAMGTPLREIVYGIGGGIPNRRRFKAVQTGGPSGGCLPAELLDINVGFGKLAEAGSIMGSGGMIVMDEDTCMVEVARYFVNFLVQESCGQCAPCREGLHRMLDVLTGITQGRGREDDLELLRELCELLTNFSLCGLGKSAATPVLSTLRWFPQEYQAHIKEKRCPAGVCKSLFHLEIDAQSCVGCGLCRLTCPAAAINGQLKTPHSIDQDLCVKCSECRRACRFQSTRVLSPLARLPG